MLQINPEILNVFINKPLIAFKRNKKIYDLIGGDLIYNVKIVKKKLENGKVKARLAIQ